MALLARKVAGNADQVTTITNPAPGTGQSAQVTTFYFDSTGRVNGQRLPDASTKTNLFFQTGLLQKTYGSRTYPVEYTYDPQGRMLTMRTWQNFSGNSGTATTIWNYDSYRGWLSSKRDNSNHGVDYTYTPAGRLSTRKWARNGGDGERITTTYG